MSDDKLDNAAAAALWFLALERDARLEHLGALYAQGENYARTDPISKGLDARVSGTLKVPRGSLRGLFHNHPLQQRTPDGRGLDASDEDRARFSPDDRRQAKALGVPSYISAGDRVMRYDPKTDRSAEVLAEFPWEEERRRLMVKILMRAPDDPRGLYR